VPERERDKLARRSEATSPARFRLLPNHVFHHNKPAIVGVEILAGNLSVGARIQRQDGKVVGRIKEMQSGKETVKQAKAGEKIAISIEDVTIGRQLAEGDIVYSFISTDDEAILRGGELSTEEKQILLELREIRRKARTEE
jgi:translation initiation factor 5B